MNDLYYVEVTFFCSTVVVVAGFARASNVFVASAIQVYECWEANENISTRETMNGSQKHGTTCMLCQRLNSSLSSSNR